MICRGFQKIYRGQKVLRNSVGANRSHLKAFFEKQKEHDPNPWFSGITFFSGLASWSFQIKKRSLMGCLFFDADFLTFFILTDKISRFAKSSLPIQI